MLLRTNSLKNLLFLSLQSFSQHSAKSFMDYHLWLSLLGRPSYSRFTRTQVECFVFFFANILFHSVFEKSFWRLNKSHMAYTQLKSRNQDIFSSDKLHFLQEILQCNLIPCYEFTSSALCSNRFVIFFSAAQLLFIIATEFPVCEHCLVPAENRGMYF